MTETRNTFRIKKCYMGLAHFGIIFLQTLQ